MDEMETARAIIAEYVTMADIANSAPPLELLKQLPADRVASNLETARQWLRENTPC